VFYPEVSGLFFAQLAYKAMSSRSLGPVENLTIDAAVEFNDSFSSTKSDGRKQRRRRPSLGRMVKHLRRCSWSSNSSSEHKVESSFLAHSNTETQVDRKMPVIDHLIEFDLPSYRFAEKETGGNSSRNTLSLLSENELGGCSSVQSTAEIHAGKKNREFDDFIEHDLPFYCSTEKEIGGNLSRSSLRQPGQCSIQCDDDNCCCYLCVAHFDLPQKIDTRAGLELACAQELKNSA